MKLYIDDLPVSEQIASDGALRDALQHIQAEHCKPGRMVVGFRCNGEAVAAETMSNVLEQAAASFEKIEVFTSTRETLVVEAMTQASVSLDQTDTASKEIASLIVENKVPEAVENLGDCLRVWQQIHEAVVKSLTILELDPKALMIQDRSLLELIGQPRDVLTQGRDALQSHDHVLLADILRYEFAEVIQSWQSVVARLRQEAEERTSA